MDDRSKLKESALMKQVQEGNQAAYAQLLDLVGRKILSLIRKRIRDEQIVEELYQNVLMTIHRARHTYDASRPFSPWMYSITRNTVFDYLRKNRKKIEFETLVGEHYDAQAPQDTQQEEQHLLQKALKTLPETQREAVTLLKLKGMTLEEAASETGITVAAMKVRAHRGYENLKKFLMNEIKEAS